MSAIKNQFNIKNLQYIMHNVTGISNMLLLVVLPFNICVAQINRDTDDDFCKYSVDLEQHISVMSGYTFWRYHYGELGVAYNRYGRVGLHPFSRAYFVSCEMRLDKNVIIGPKVGVWIGGGVAVGMNLIYYTNFNQSSLRIRPEMGIGFGRWKIVYGYNIPLTNKGFEKLNKSNIGVLLMFGVKKIKSIRIED